MIISLHKQLVGIGLSAPTAEYRFHPTRRWRFDYAYPSIKLAIEIEGAVYAQGRHTRGSGYEADIEKYNAATLLGWRLLRFSTGQVKSGYALATIETFLNLGNILHKPRQIPAINK